MATDGAHYARYHPYGDPAESERPSGRDQAPPDYPGHGASVLEMSVIATTEEEDGAREDVDVGFHRRLSTDSVSSACSSIDENLSVASITSSIVDRLTWRGRMQVTLHSPVFHWFVISLVILDAMIVLFELLLDLGAFGNVLCRGEDIIEQAEFCHYSSKFRDQCGPPAILLLEGLNITAPPNGTRGLGDDTCVCEFRDGKRVCIEVGSGRGVNPAIILHITSLFILSTFMVEILLKLVAFRLKYFLPGCRVVTFKNGTKFKFYLPSFEVFDGIVVVISWILDIASLKEEEAFELIDLVIILRLWRIVRVVNGTVLSAKAQLDQQLQEARHHARNIITALHKAQDKLELVQKDNQVLRKRLMHDPTSVQSPDSPGNGEISSFKPPSFKSTVPEITIEEVDTEKEK